MGGSMAIEIELKAWVDNTQDIKSKLSEAAVYRGSFEKNDVYYFPDSQFTASEDYGVRIRNEAFTDSSGITKEATIVTYKIKELRGKIEVNEENEFDVSSGTAFEKFLKHQGFREKVRKHKKGDSYDYNGMTIELTEVEGLGWFIELEILIIERDNEKIEKERDRLLVFLDKLGIPQESIEGRSYTSMLIGRVGSPDHMSHVVGQ
jgi:adenylate cyclase class 2